MKILADLHTHTIASGHAYNTIMEMVHAAALKELPFLGISDHAPSLQGSADDIYFRNLKVIPRELEGVRLLFGCELNIMDYKGTTDLSVKALYLLDYTIASLHNLCIPYGTKEQNTAGILGAMENPYVKIIGHPDDGRFPIDSEAVVKAAGKHKKLLEINNSSLVPGSSRSDAHENDLLLLDYCKKYEVPVIMGSDAHFMTEVANHEYSEAVIREAGFPEDLVANYSIDLLAEYIPAIREYF